MSTVLCKCCTVLHRTVLHRQQAAGGTRAQQVNTAGATRHGGWLACSNGRTTTSCQRNAAARVNDCCNCKQHWHSGDSRCRRSRHHCSVSLDVCALLGGNRRPESQPAVPAHQYMPRVTDVRCYRWHVVCVAVSCVRRPAQGTKCSQHDQAWGVYL